MSTSKSRPKIRPRPRVRASQEPGSDDAREEAESNQSVLSRSPAPSATASPSQNKKVGNLQRTSSNTTVTAHGQGINNDDDDDDDEDDFYFHTSKLNTLPKPAVGNILDEDDEEDDEMMDSSQSTPQTRRRAKDHKAAYRAEWTKKASKKRPGGLDSDMDETDDDEEDEMTDSTVEGDAGNRRTSKGPSMVAKKKTRRRSISLELTPPPEIQPEKIEILNKTVREFLQQNGGQEQDINDDDALDGVFNNENINKTIHPDLLRLYRGREGSQLRRKMRETQPASIVESQDRLPLPAALPKKTLYTAQIFHDPIELSDSDDSAPSGSTERGIGKRMQKDRDSSPIEVLEFRRATDALASPVTANSDQRNSNFVLPLPTTNEQEADLVRVKDSAILIPSPLNDTKPVVEEEEEEERITVILKAEGGIQESVKVKQTTVVGTLLNHFINTHRAKIPRNRISKVRIRFDGETLTDKQTMQDLEIDEDDQLDVVW